MDMFNNVTSSVTTWWGKGGKKGEEGGAAADNRDDPSQLEPVDAAAEEQQPSADQQQPGDAAQLATGSPTGSEKSPPTSEADSASIASQADEIGAAADAADLKDKPVGPGFGGIAVDIEEVSSKAFQSAKNLGSFLFSVGKKAGKTVSETAKHLKHTVEENSILGDFNKEQEAFMQEKNQQRTEAAVPPWVGYSEEEEMKQQILSLSQDRRNFLRSPPSGVTFEFEYDSMHPIAQATLAEDPNLEKMRFELVPKCISEENFWKNYFYRVSLIKQSAQLSSLAQETGSTGGGDSSAKSSRKSSVDEGKADRRNVGAETKLSQDNLNSNDQSGAMKNVSSAAAPASAPNMSGVKIANEEEWEKELQQELQEYEVVNDGDQPHLDDAEWEQEIQKMLAAEDAPQK